MKRIELINALGAVITPERSVTTALGVFALHRHPAADARDPQTGEMIIGMIPGRSKVCFVPSRELLADVVGSGAASDDLILADVRQGLAKNAIRQDLAHAFTLPAESAALDLGDFADEVRAKLRAGERATSRFFGSFARKPIGRGAARRTSIVFDPARELAEVVYSL